jgi:hypothetical protein
MNPIFPREVLNLALADVPGKFDTTEFLNTALFFVF